MCMEKKKKNSILILLIQSDIHCLFVNPEHHNPCQRVGWICILLLVDEPRSVYLAFYMISY